MTDATRPRLAVLIDAENISASHVSTIMTRAAAFGTLVTRRAYGYWVTPQLTPWKNVIDAHAIQPQQLPRRRRGRNSADVMLVMDAMELIHEGHVQGICIVSSDSDFVGLALRIREAGLLVYGFGQGVVPKPFVEACDGFVFLEKSIDASGSA